MSGFCTTFILSNGDSYVKKAEIIYDEINGVSQVTFLGNMGHFSTFGDSTQFYRAGLEVKQQKWDFTSTDQLIGLYGTHRVGIESFGVLIFRTTCMDAPVESEPEDSIISVSEEVS